MRQLQLLAATPLAVNTPFCVREQRRHALIYVWIVLLRQCDHVPRQRGLAQSSANGALCCAKRCWLRTGQAGGVETFINFNALSEYLSDFLLLIEVPNPH